YDFFRFLYSPQMECEPTRLNASSLANNVSPTAPSVAVNLSRKAH
ncbi:hypothetical protein ALQ01_05233, partial [Pseudomonas savastanoi pv. glycinea]